MWSLDWIDRSRSANFEIRSVPGIPIPGAHGVVASTIVLGDAACPCRRLDCLIRSGPLNPTTRKALELLAGISNYPVR